MATFTTKFGFGETVWVIDTYFNNQIYEGNVASVYLCPEDEPEYEICRPGNDTITATESNVFASHAAAVAKVAELFRVEKESRIQRLKQDIGYLEESLQHKRILLEKLNNGEELC